jgi:hypothetical protein
MINRVILINFIWLERFFMSAVNALNILFSGKNQVTQGAPRREIVKRVAGGKDECSPIGVRLQNIGFAVDDL